MRCVSSWATQHSFFGFSSRIPSLPSQRRRGGRCHTILSVEDGRSNFRDLRSLLPVTSIESTSKLRDFFMDCLWSFLLFSQYEEPAVELFCGHQDWASKPCACVLSLWSFKVPEWFHSSKARSKLMVWRRTLAKIQYKWLAWQSTSTIPSLFYKHPTSQLYTIILDIHWWCWTSHKLKVTLSTGPFRLSEVYQQEYESLTWVSVLYLFLHGPLRTSWNLRLPGKKRPSMREFMIETPHIQSVGHKSYEAVDIRSQYLESTTATVFLFWRLVPLTVLSTLCIRPKKFNSRLEIQIWLLLWWMTATAKSGWQDITKGIERLEGFGSRSP